MNRTVTLKDLNVAKPLRWLKKTRKKTFKRFRFLLFSLDLLNFSGGVGVGGGGGSRGCLVIWLMKSGCVTIAETVFEKRP